MKFKTKKEKEKKKNTFNVFYLSLLHVFSRFDKAFLFIIKQYFITCMDCKIIYSFTVGHLVCLPVLATTNKLLYILICRGLCKYKFPTHLNIY